MCAIVTLPWSDSSSRKCPAIPDARQAMVGIPESWRSDKSIPYSVASRATTRGAGAANEFGVPIRKITRRIAGPGQTGVGILAERVPDELLRRYLRPIQIPPGQTVTSKIDAKPVPAWHRNPRLPAPSMKTIRQISLSVSPNTSTIV